MRDYEKSGFSGQTTRLMVEMRNVFSCEPNFKSYTVVLEILVAGDCHEVAANVFDDMLSRRIPPTVFTFGAVMKGLCVVNEIDSALSLLRDMTKHGCVPNSVIYQTLIHSLSKCNRMKEALQLLEEMLLMGCIPDADTLNGVILCLCKFDRINKAAKMVKRMLIRGFAPDDITYGVLMNGLCKIGRVDAAKDLFSRIPKPNIVIFNTLFHGCLHIQLADLWIVEEWSLRLNSGSSSRYEEQRMGWCCHCGHQYHLQTLLTYRSNPLQWRMVLGVELTWHLQQNKQKLLLGILKNIKRRDES